MIRTELHIHTNMSTMDGISTARDYMLFASENDVKAVAITDHGNVQAFCDAYKAAVKFGVKLIYGAEICMTENGKRLCDVMLLAKNKEGLKDLYKIISLANTIYFNKIPCVPKDELNKNRENLLIGASCENSEIFQGALTDITDDKFSEIMSFYDYFEIEPPKNCEYLVRDNKLSNDELIGTYKRIIGLAKANNKLVSAVSNAHFTYQEDGKARSVLLCAKGFEHFDEQPPLYMRDTQEMLDEFELLGESIAKEIVIENPNLIANQIDDTFPPFSMERHYPEIENAIEIITKKSYDKLHSIYGRHPNEKIMLRLDDELSAIGVNDYASIYYIASLITGFSKENGYQTGTRGTIGSSFIAFLLGITEINPLSPHYICSECNYTEFSDSAKCGADLKDKCCPICQKQMKKDGYNIPFTSLAGATGDKEPDISINLADEIRDKCIAYLKSKFGDNNVIAAGTISKISEKTAIKNLEGYISTTACKLDNDTKNYILEQLCEVKRTTGMHPGGVFIVPKDKKIYDFTPIRYFGGNPNYITTLFDYHDLWGRLFKLDLLTHDDLSILYQLEKSTGVKSSYIPLNDRQTFELINNNTSGIREFSSDCVKRMIKLCKPCCIDDLIRISGLAHGTGTWTGNAQSLIKKNKAELKDVISTRDDITVFLKSVGMPDKTAFEMSESIRKGRGLTEDDEFELEKFNIPDWYIDSCNKIFYLFPRAHSAGYVLNAYRLAYYKAHYPLEFYAAFFNVISDLYSVYPEVLQGAEIISKGKSKFTHHIDDINCEYDVLSEFYKAGYEFENTKNATHSSKIKFAPKNGKLVCTIIE